MRRVDWALQYARQGYRVMPAFIIPNKITGKAEKVPANRRVLLKPCARHTGQIGTEAAATCHECAGGAAAATTNERYIKWMWKQRPSALVAVLAAPGTVILDDDSYVFDLLWGTFPRVRSQSGKSHYWFRLAEGQAQPPSENGIVFSEPDGVVDLRGDGDAFWIFAPCGGSPGKYQPENGWASDPAGLPVLPQSVYMRLLEAPRRGVAGGGRSSDGLWSVGVRRLAVGNAYDREPGACEEILERHGWISDDGEHWIRPGGSHSNAQLSPGKEDSDVWFFSVYTTSDEFLKAGCYYTASMLRCVLDHGGDWRKTYDQLISEAARLAFSEGLEP